MSSCVIVIIDMCAGAFTNAYFLRLASVGALSLWSVTVTLLVGALLLLHIYLCWTGKTTAEYLRGARPQSNTQPPRDTGTPANIDGVPHLTIHTPRRPGAGGPIVPINTLTSPDYKKRVCGNRESSPASKNLIPSCPPFSPRNAQHNTTDAVDAPPGSSTTCISAGQTVCIDCMTVVGKIGGIGCAVGTGMCFILSYPPTRLPPMWERHVVVQRRDIGGHSGDLEEGHSGDVERGLLGGGVERGNESRSKSLERKRKRSMEMKREIQREIERESSPESGFSMDSEISDLKGQHLLIDAGEGRDGRREGGLGGEYGEEGTGKRNDEVGENVYNAEGETHLATSHTNANFTTNSPNSDSRSIWTGDSLRSDSSDRYATLHVLHASL